MSPFEHPEATPIDAGTDLSLNAKDWNAAQALATSAEYRPRATSCAQAELMARSSQIELKPEEIVLYAALREQATPEAGGRAMGQGERNGIRPYGMSDQRILAAVLRSAGDQDRVKKFEASFSAIFGIEQ